MMSSSLELVTTIDILRHGACEGGEIYRGRTDVPLSAEGWQQMERATDPARNWQRIVSSPLLRCREFAQRFAEDSKLPLETVDDFQEIDFGEWEGRLLQEVWEADPDLVSRIYDDPSAATPPGGEPTVDAQRRVVAGWQNLLQQCAGETLLVVCHGGIMRLMLSHLLNMPVQSIFRLHIPYASLMRIRIYHRDSGDFPVLMSLNASRSAHSAKPAESTL